MRAANRMRCHSETEHRAGNMSSRLRSSSTSSSLSVVSSVQHDNEFWHLDAVLGLTNDTHMACDCAPPFLAPLDVVQHILRSRCCSTSLYQPEGPGVRRSPRLLGKKKCKHCGNIALTCNWKCCPTSDCTIIRDLDRLCVRLCKMLDEHDRNKTRV